ncbi:MAG: cobyrinate a,c-diamide synthase [Hydrotalea sp.]|nr:cobyrinate a,c-diamide synthase [Hydrotalea sp.]
MTPHANHHANHHGGNNGGLVISAVAETLASGSGKTTLTAALLAATKQQGAVPQAYKIGPDYLDGKIHGRIAERPCFNLDGFAMPRDKIITLLNQSTIGQPRIIEGVMGLFDGARGASRHGSGNTAAITRDFGFALLLLVRGDENPQAIATMVQPIATQYRLLAVVVNEVKKIAVDKNQWQDCWRNHNLPTPLVFLRQQDFTLPHRHLGLHQAEEWDDTTWRDTRHNLMQLARDFETACGPALWREILAASLVREPIAQNNIAQENSPSAARQPSGAPYRLAVARDRAFGFIYPHHLFFWQQKNIDVSFFSPLADETPANNADAIFLPGGYPELHLRELSNAKQFFQNLRQTKSLVYGECGGFMMLGQEIIDGAGVAFPALGLLPHRTSFAKPSLHLGYRHLQPYQKNLSPNQQAFFSLLFDDSRYGHEFHYCANLSPQTAAPLFSVEDSLHNKLGDYGEVASNGHGHGTGNIMGSFLHLL